MRQAPTGVDVIGRILSLTSAHNRAGHQESKNAAYNIAANELVDFWCFGLDIYPKTRRAVAEKIKLAYEGKSKSNNNKKSVRGFQYMIWKCKDQTEIMQFNDKMRTGFDIRTTDKKRQKVLEAEYDVKMKDEDVALYHDNCKQKTCSCEWDCVIKCPDCPRQMYTSTELDADWQVWYSRKHRDDNRTNGKEG